MVTNTNPPNICVTSMMPITGNTFLALFTHLSLLPTILCCFSSETPGAVSSATGICTQPAWTHSRKPLNMSATPMITALGRYIPILRNDAGVVMI